MDERNYPQGAVGKVPHFDGQCRPDSNAGTARAMTQQEIIESQLKQSQATSAPKPDLPPLSQLVVMVSDAARENFNNTGGLLGQVEGGRDRASEVEREFDGIKGTLIMVLRYLAASQGNIARVRQEICVLLLCLFLGSGVAFAQKPAAPAPGADDNIACSNKVQPTTGFTECEMLRLSNYMSQLQAIKDASDKQATPVSTQGNEFVGKVIALERNKGKQYESPSQQFPLGRLVPIPAPAAPTDPHTGQPAVAPTAAPAAAPAPATPPAKQ